MSVRRWPDTFPVPSLPGFAIQPVDPSIRTPMEVGAARVRRRTFSRLDKVTLEWRMTPFQYAALRAWYEGLSYSLLGGSDDLAVWEFGTRTTRSIGAGISPQGLAVDRVLETVTLGQHWITRYDTKFAVDNANLQFCASVKPAGRTLGRLDIGDRNGVICYTEFDLGTGTLGAQSGLLSRSIMARGNSWYRVVIQANLGTGVSPPYVRARLRDDTGANTYTGCVTKGFDVCETQVRFVTGNDLFVPTETDGTTLGAAGGSSWFMMPLAMDSGLQTVECRFTTPFKSTAGAGLNRIVTAEVEVRNA